MDSEKELDYYQILGCSPENTKEQITTEYRKRVLKLHPDKHSKDTHHDTDDFAVEFTKLQKAYETLTNDETRKLYDKWKNCGVEMTFKDWCALSEDLRNSFHWRTRNTQPTIEYEKQHNTSVQQDDGPGSLIHQFRNYEI